MQQVEQADEMPNPLRTMGAGSLMPGTCPSTVTKALFHP
jgi:hypothetical protein